MSFRSERTKILPHELSVEQQRLYDQIRHGPRGAGTAFAMTDERDRLVGPYGAMLLSPPIGQALQALGEVCRFATSLTARQVELVILAVADFRTSAFIRYAHRRIAAQIGFSSQELDRHHDGELDATDGGDGVEASQRRLTLRLLRRTQLTDAEFAAFDAELGATALMEICAIIGYYNLLADLLALFDIRVDDAAIAS